MCRSSWLLVAAVVLVLPATNNAQEQVTTKRDTSYGDQMIAQYFQAETQRIEKQAFSRIKTLDDWNSERKKRRAQLFEMLGMNPMPARTPLKATITGRTEHDEFVVENLHFQSRPGLYVTANFYRPKNAKQKLPTILYVCGHGRVKKNGVSYGNKVHYHHHGSWFARNGYNCLTIDTLQLGEIEGIHHGTYNHNRWWWNSRGYSSAGVEAWNCIRALDYLETRPEVDADRFGVTGRSGGGAYSWWISALDERIKVSVPVAGITTLKNHIVDGCVEGHCDCMYMVNTYGWDYAEVAALVAPRPLLISNTDKDRIFPLDGVVEIYNKTRRIYELYGKRDHIGLQICEGPHKDTQELRIHAFHWFNRFLKAEDPLIEKTATKFFQPEQLKVFDKLPEDEINTTIDETFTAKAALPKPNEIELENCHCAGYRKRLLESCFRGWPSGLNNEPAIQQVFSGKHDGLLLTAYDFAPQQHIQLRMYWLRAADRKPADLKINVLNVLDDGGWIDFVNMARVGFEAHFDKYQAWQVDKESWDANARMLKNNPWGLLYFCPRGIGPTAWDQSERKQTQIRRRFMLLGQTRDGMQLWDTRKALLVAKSIAKDHGARPELWMQAKGATSGVALYAALFDWSVKRLDLYDMPNNHREGPTFLNVLRLTDMQDSVAWTSHRTKVVIYDNDPSRWSRTAAIAAAQKKRSYGGFEVRKLPDEN